MTEMKKAYQIVVIFLSATILAWFLPWLYAIAFPVSLNDPFVAFSPVSESFIVSENDGSGKIFEFSGHGGRRAFSREQRDSLLPHIYLNQLLGRGHMPDSVAGMPVSVHDLKQAQWVFTSLPRDVNRVAPTVYLLMESMPARFELEDPQKYFHIVGRRVEVADIETGEVDEISSERFTKLFEQRRFKFPIAFADADITARKPYDEGYMLVDANGDLYHLKMQVGRPYLVKVALPAGVKARYAFIMENVDRRQLALFTDTENNLYAVEHEGYRILKLPVGSFDPVKERMTIVKNLFNWVVKISDGKSTRWVALASDSHALLGSCERDATVSHAQEVSGFIFPFRLSFVSVDDCYVKPRIDSFSWKAAGLDIVLALIIGLVMKHRGRSVRKNCLAVLFTVVAGIFAAIPLLIIKN